MRYRLGLVYDPAISVVKVAASGAAYAKEAVQPADQVPTSRRGQQNIERPGWESQHQAFTT
jgi:hypothetical protein